MRKENSMQNSGPGQEKYAITNQIARIKDIANLLDQHSREPHEVQSLSTSLKTSVEALEIFARNLPTEQQGQSSHS
jgi:N6-adenosine-specific RNA methylase IME4